MENALARYYEDLQRTADAYSHTALAAVSQSEFRPSFRLPPLTPTLREFFAVSSIGILDVGEYRGVRLRLLDLTRNPRTRTTKTFAAALMVARAVGHIHETGESVMLLTPTSANKGSALRDAVSRAIETRLVTADQLRISIVVPRPGLAKLWSLPLSQSEELRARNPIFVVSTDQGSVVKDITRTMVREHASEIYEELGLRLWHTYDLDNYRSADAVRAFVEADHLASPAALSRIHAQAVSSAFGLMGHHHGWRALREVFLRDPGPHPEFLLVQHLGTPDLVLHQRFGSFARENLPAYRLDTSTGLLTQSSSDFFPAKTYAVDEVIDSTFYSRHPFTADAMSAIQQCHGGTGVVVSLYECLERYGFLRNLLPAEGPQLPPDPRDLREWALVMVLTGVLGAIDRGMVASGREVLVHVSGSYSTRDYTPVLEQHTLSISTARDIMLALRHGGEQSLESAQRTTFVESSVQRNDVPSNEPVTFAQVGTTHL